jgi:hypothetical protein
MDADKIYIDEMAFVPYMLIQDVISPLLKMKNSVVVSASTQQKKTNHFSKFFDEDYKKKANIDHLVITMQTDLLCTECREAGTSAFECEHGDFKHPAFNLAANKERAGVFVSDKDKYAQEMMGSFAANEVSVLDDEIIDTLRQKEMDMLLDLVPEETVVWTYIDPNGGAHNRGKHGPASKLGMISLIRGAGRSKIIVAAHSQQAVGERETLHQVTQYFKSMADSQFLSRCRHVLFVEHNYGGCLTADYFFNRARRQLPQMQMVNWFNDAPGVRKTRENGSSGVMTLVVDMQENNISIYYALCGVTPTAAIEAVSEMLEQMSRLHKVRHADGVYSYSAKTATACDDVLVSYYMAVYFSYHFLMMQHFEQLDEGLRGMPTSQEYGLDPEHSLSHLSRSIESAY